MNPLAATFVPRKIRTDIPIENLDDFHRRSTTVCQCLSTRCTHDKCKYDCNDNYNFVISIYNDTIAVYDEDHSQFFYLEGNLSLREVLGYLGYTRDDISQLPDGWPHGFGEDDSDDDSDDSLLYPILTKKPRTLVALQ